MYISLCRCSETFSCIRAYSRTFLFRCACVRVLSAKSARSFRSFSRRVPVVVSFVRSSVRSFAGSFSSSPQVPRPRLPRGSLGSTNSSFRRCREPRTLGRSFACTYVQSQRVTRCTRVGSLCASTARSEYTGVLPRSTSHRRRSASASGLSISFTSVPTRCSPRGLTPVHTIAAELLRVSVLARVGENINSSCISYGDPGCSVWGSRDDDDPGSSGRGDRRSSGICRFRFLANLDNEGWCDVARDGDAILPGARQSYDEGGRVNGCPGVADEWTRSGPPSLSMSVDLNPNLQDSGHFSASPERVDGSCDKPVKNDEEESYEAFGSVEGDADDGVDSPPGGSSSAPSPTGTNSHLKNPRSPNSTIGRHSWLRTSLRRTPPCSGRKRLSSNALASQLYRSGSFNSSGRGSNCDPADDMYSDVSLEDDVIIGLNHKMCARNSPCQSPPRARSSTTENPTDDRYRNRHPPPHPPYIPYYPPPPPPPYLSPYGSYPYHHPPGGYYAPYCNDVQESKDGSSGSWFGIVLLILLLLCVVTFIFYRSLSRDTQQRLHTRLPTLMQPAAQVQMIQEQMDALVDTQSVGEERYARVKQENAMLQARILMLEEAAKDAETRAEERLQAEQRRYRDWASRLERERQLQLENYAIKLQAIESEGTNLREEIGRLREQLEKVKAEKSRLENDLEETRRELDSARECERQAVSRANEAQYQVEVAREELDARIGDQQRIEELMQQVEELLTRNKSLEESRDELQAAAALQAGRELLMLNPCSSSSSGSSNNSAEKGPSLAVELLAGMNQDHQMDGQFVGENGEQCSITEIRQMLKEQQEVNTQLRTYIDGILLNIVENYPQLLEVKQAH